jgi:transcriptional regulator with GAF, ATPase, and Fis domain
MLRAVRITLCAPDREDLFSADDVAMLAQAAGQIAIALDNALSYKQIEELNAQLADEKIYLEDEIRTEHQFEEIIGQSAALKAILKQVETVAPTDSNVLIYGETGTGKELVARAIHDLSGRRQGTFVKLNCAAIPTGLLESELFGHEKGAFTGAIAQRVGRFELAHKGTVFLERSARFRSITTSCCGSCRSESSSGSAAHGRCGRTPGSSPQPTAHWRTWYGITTFVPTFTTG